MAALVPSNGPDASLTVVVDGSKAIAGLNVIQAQILRMQNTTTTAVNKMTQSFNTMSSVISKVGASLVAYFGARALAGMFGGFLERLIEVNRVFTGFIATMNVVKGSIAASRREYAFLLDMSNKLGVSVETTTTQYAKLAASLKNVDKSGELTRHLFTAISEAAVVLHSRGRDVTLIFEAFQQMASKGKLSLEELQRQLGNTLPGAVGLAARAMGKSEAELRQGIQKGTINVYEFLAKVANQIKKEYGGSVQYAADQFTARLNVMKNSVFELYRVVGESGALKGLTNALNNVIKVLQDPNVGVVIGQALGDLFEKLADWISKLDAKTVEEFFYAVAGAFGSLKIILEGVVDAFTSLNGDSQAPLLDFTRYVAVTFAAVVDVIRVAVLMVRQLVADFGVIWDDMIVSSNAGVIKLLQMESKLDRATGGKMFSQDRRNERNAYLADMNDRRRNVEHGQGSADPDGRYAQIGGIISGNGDSAVGSTRAMFDQLGARLNRKSRVGVRGGKGYGYTSGTDYTAPQSDADMQRMIDELTKGGAGNATTGKGGAGGGRKDNTYGREQTTLLKDMAKAENEYQNIAANRPKIEDANVERIRTLITEDDRYMKLTDAQKGSLMKLAEQLDAIVLKKEMLIKVTKYQNDTDEKSARIQQSISDLNKYGYTSSFNEANNAQASFGKGGENEFLDAASRQKILSSAMKRDADDRNLDMAQYAANLRKANEELAFQQSLYGMTATEAEKVRKFHEIDLWLQEKSVGATAEQLEAYREMARVLKGEVGKALDDVEAKQQSILAGIKDGLAKYADQIGTPMKAFSDLALSGVKHIEDSFLEFVTTGKTSFKDLVRTMLIELARVLIQLYIMKPLVEYINSKSGSSDSKSGDTTGQVVGIIGQIAASFFSAKGNVFDSTGMMKFANGGAFSNSIITKPTNFNVGQMGEAGPEAVMPLTRNAKGQLGISSDGMGGGSGDINVSTTVVIQSDGTTNTKTNSDSDNADAKKLGEMITNKVKEVLVNERRNGGLLWGMQNGR